MKAMLVSAWQRRGWLACLLLPVAGLFGLLAAWRRLLFRYGVFRRIRLDRPVVVVGNVTVGGAGKTPLTLWLARELLRRGKKPGIVSRGYGGSASVGGEVRQVRQEDDADEVGDEPLLMARRALCPVWIGRDRALAGQALIHAHPECDVLLCDDGLQHYRLARDVEIVVMDGRGAGNGFLLPAGPLREPLSRIQQAQALVINGGIAAPSGLIPTFSMSLHGNVFYRLDHPQQRRESRDFQGMKLHALAGIGHPQRFFDHLSAMGLQVVCHAFPDHHRFCVSDIKSIDGAEVLLMTEKDGVKCAAIASELAPMEIWVLPVEAELDSALGQLVVEKLNGSPSA